MASNTYKVQPGDNLTLIGKKTGIPVDDLVKINGIENPNLIYSGQELKLYYDEPTTATGATKAPTIADAPTAPKQTYTPWGSTQQGKDAQKAREDALKAITEHGGFAWADQKKYDDYISKYENRPDFSYDFNADALYQQYKDKYIKQGKMAMQDTIGQASAMTGGYGNSYAQAVGNQAYQASLENLNDIIPELYQMAYDRYNQKGQDMLNMISLMRGERDFAYGEHSDKYNQLVDMLNRADSNYYNGANLHGSEQDSINQAAQQNWQNEFSIWDANNSNAWKEAGWNEAIRQWLESHDLQERQVSLQEKQYEDSKKSDVVVTDDDDDGGYTPPKKAEEDEEEEPFKAVDNEKTKAFQAGIRTKNEFYGRGNHSDKEKYETYDAYIEGKLDEWLNAGKLNEDEVATLIAYYGL